MKKLLLTGTLAIFACFSLISLAQDTSKPAAAKATPADKKSDSTAKKGRLPANFGKLGLNDSQKDKIYSVQASYADQLEELENQISMVKAKRDKEIEHVLTADQRNVLKNLNDAAKEKSKKEEPAAPADEDKTSK